jgi:hypothetical protein
MLHKDRKPRLQSVESAAELGPEQHHLRKLNATRPTPAAAVRA